MGTLFPTLKENNSIIQVYVEYAKARFTRLDIYIQKKCIYFLIEIIEKYKEKST